MLILDRNKALSEWTHAQRNGLEFMLHQKSVKEGEVIWEEGKPVEQVIIVKEGACQFFNCFEDDKPLGPGTFIGETMTIMENGKNRTSLRVTRDSELFFISATDFLVFLKNNPGLLLALKDVNKLT